MKPDTDTMAKRYTSIIVIVVLLAVLVILRALGFMTFGRRGWQTVARRFEADSVVVQPQRGSILSDEGRVLVSSTPEYQLVFKYRDFTKGRDEQKYRDEVVRRHIGDYAEGLHRLMPEQSAAEFRTLIDGALRKGNAAAETGTRSRGYYTNLYTRGSRRLTYNRYKEVKAFLDSCDIEYTLYANLGVGNRANRRLLAAQWRDSLDAITEGLHRIVPSFSALSFRDSITRAIEHPGKQMRLCSITVSERQMQQISQLPVLGRGRKAGLIARQTAAPRGFTFDEVMVRKNAYGLLATRTLGMWDEQNGRARNGIELAYDSVLRGTPGFSHRRKVMDTYAEYIDLAPQNGCDIVTTLDVRIQDIANKALRDQMEEQNGDLGTAIVMETATGDIKAIVNLTRQDGQFVIDNNIALNQGIETGSIFKTASMLAALDDGEVVLDDSVNTAPYARTFYGFNMADDTKRIPWKDIRKILKYSSNVGTMTVIDDHYVKKGKGEAFLNKLLSFGIAADHQVIPGAAKSKLKTPEQLKNWKGEALWMAVGYGIHVTPVNMVAFYNAIANGGKMMRPRLIKEIQRDGHTIERFDTQVAVEAIARKEAIDDITQCLIGVVNSEGGTGVRAHSDRFLVAGKTGTAKINEGGQYAGRWLNFCGFFPADKPEYTCGVFVYRKAGHVGAANGGGTMSAPVLREIAERVMAYQKTTQVEDLRDSLAIFVPDIKMGNAQAADEVLDGLKIKGDSLRGTDWTAEEGKVPNVVGMGAKDAIYALESCGIKARLNGVGKVHRQGIAPGAERKKGMTVELFLK